MKIVLCNKYFFLNGGTERYLNTCMEGLARRGHEPVPFSVAYAGNWPSPYSHYFLPPPGRPEESHFSRIRGARLSPLSALRYVERASYSFEARRGLDRLLTAIGEADIGYILNIYNYMSPSIVHSFRRRSIPVVLRFGDYHPLCASYAFLRGGRTCLKCARGDYYHGLLHRCVKNSLAASALRVFSMYVHRLLDLYRGADAFVAPCGFMRDRLVEGGFPEDRIHIIRQPAPAETPEPGPKGNYILYFGRISPEKGLDTLLAAYQEARPAADLVLIGRSYDGHREQLEQLVRPGFEERIRFLDFMDGPELSRQLSGALLSVVPSRWFDNAPLSVYESYVHGTPVLAANIGGIPEQVRRGETGELFVPDSVPDLAAKLGQMLADREGLARMGETARLVAATELTLDRHLDSLLSLFESLRNGNRLAEGGAHG